MVRSQTGECVLCSGSDLGCDKCVEIMGVPGIQGGLCSDLAICNRSFLIVFR